MRSRSPVTDDRPFAWSVYQNNIPLDRSLSIIGALCFALLIIIIAYWSIINGIKFVLRPKYIIYCAYFALIGLGYLIIEVNLISRLQRYAGSPSYTFIFILGALLLSSGIGSLLSRGFTNRLRIAACVGILLFSAFQFFFIDILISKFGAGPITNSLLITLSIMPLGFCMGIPFPYGLEKVKDTQGEDHVPFFFSINCLFATFAVFLSFYLSVMHGLQMTFIIGILCYMMALPVILFAE